MIIANSTNMGLSRMSDACGIGYDTLAWTQEWYVREETLRAANPENDRLPPAATAHRDLRQRHPVLLGRATLPDEGKIGHRPSAQSATSSTRACPPIQHVTDQHAVFGTKIIVATDREFPYVLDEILGNQTDLPITEHATDTHGASLINFALFDLVGCNCRPRIRDLGKITLPVDAGRSTTRAMSPARRAAADPADQLALIAEHWDEMLRLGGVAEVRARHRLPDRRQTLPRRTGRTRSPPRSRNTGRFGSTIYAAHYLSREDYRRKISRQLNKGESMHALKRDVFYANEGAVHRSAPAAADRASMVPDTRHECHHDAGRPIPRPGCRSSAISGPPCRP